MTKCSMTKERLQQYAYTKMELENQCERLEQERAALELPGRRLDGMPRGDSDADRMANKLVHLLEREEQLELAVLSLYAEKNAVEAFVSSLPDALLREMVRMRYLEGYKTGEIAERLSYSTREIDRKFAKIGREYLA